ncbi:MAG: hypothetical protein ABII26_11510 [Pseudomonadota bacterium]
MNQPSLKYLLSSFFSKNVFNYFAGAGGSHLKKSNFNLYWTALGKAEKFRQTIIPDEVVPVDRYLRLQGRFKHFTDKDIQLYQRQVTARFERFKGRFDRT